MDKKKLNKDQLRAVKHKNGPLMIIAGAGTGKTTVITERVKHIIENGWALPSEILCLTFTEKAALEMETRIDEALPLGYTQMWVTTFHGFCDRVLKESAIHIGLDPKSRLLTASESLDLLQKNIFDLGLSYFRPLGNPNKFLFGLLSHFSRLQDENITCDEYLSFAKIEVEKSKNKTKEESLEAEKWLELANAYKEYNDLKIKNSLFDFGDLISKTLTLFANRPNVLNEYKKRFKYILVDEFQDTNYSQNELVKLLSGKNGNITVVLDDDQSIYAFRGSSISNALFFRKNFEKTKIISLTKNYRSYQEILDSAYTLINKNNPNRLEVVEGINKKLVAERKGKGEITLNITNASNEEARFVAQKILELIKDGKYTFSDFAVLVRANNHADIFIKEFEKFGIPHNFLGPGKLFEQPEITNLISYLRFISDINDSQSFYKILSVPTFRINPLDIARLSAVSKKRAESLFETAINLDNENINADSLEKIKKVTQKIIKDLGDASKKSAGSILYSFLEELGIMQDVLKNDTPEGVVVAENITKFFGKIKAYEISQKDSSIFNVVSWLNLMVELGESPLSSEIDIDEADGVKILTVHSSKGLEFPVVFMVNLVAQRFPSTNRSEQIPLPEALIKDTLPIGDFHLQEERRLFYVGITRAKDKLFLTASKFYGDAVREKKLSQFILELGDLKTTTQEESFKIEKEQNPKKIKIEQKRHIDSKLSYSQIETFKLCELHYKLRYILKVPTPPTSAQSFGNSFHKTLKEFYINVQNGNKPTSSLLDKLLKENWIREGFSNKKHSEESFKKAKEYLHYFLNNYYEKNKQNLGVEIPFSFKINDLKIGGIIDRVDKDKDGLHIIDYKTGEKALTQKEADRNLQLSIYALAASSIQEKPFGVTPEKIKLSLVYFNDPQVVTTYRTKKQLEEANKEILEWREKIEKSDFRCTNDFFCIACEYKMFCNTKSDS